MITWNFFICYSLAGRGGYVYLKKPKNPGCPGFSSTYKALKPVVCSHRAVVLGQKLLGAGFQFLAVQICFFELKELYIEIIELGKLFSRVFDAVRLVIHSSSVRVIHILVICVI